MKDPKFCISYLLQLLFVLESLFKPVSLTQKKCFVLQESEVPIAQGVAIEAAN